VLIAISTFLLQLRSSILKLFPRVRGNSRVPLKGGRGKGGRMERKEQGNGREGMIEGWEQEKKVYGERRDGKFPFHKF
jgi:hypothetical protein